MTDYHELIEKLDKLQTEQINQKSINIDKLPPIEIARLINDEDKTVASVVESQLEKISMTAEVYADTLRNKGRVIYIGAGTSGRLGVLDAAECPPTFGSDPSQILGVISGGYGTLVLSKEGVEDDEKQAVVDLTNLAVTKNDFVIGIAASSRTPYTLAGLEYAKSKECKTAFITCNKYLPENNKAEFDIVIELEVGPEIITGSTRMKSGTSQKLTLNMISTTAMVLLGKTYGNLMVDLQAKSEKLAARSRKILIDLFEITIDDSELLLNGADGSVKTAIVMKMFSCNKDKAISHLENAGGFISKIN